MVSSVTSVPLKPSRFDAASFQSHDEAAEAAFRQCKAAWLSEADAERLRDRFAEAAERSKRPALLIGASLPALLRERTRLTKLGFKAVVLDAPDGRIARADLEALRRGGSLLVLVTPELLARSEVESALGRVEFGSAAIDGAELASERAHEFRPAFARLSQLLANLRVPSVFALARPVPPEVRRHAQERLGLAHGALVEAPVVAREVLLETRSVRGERRNNTLLSLLPELPERGVIVCATPHDVDSVCAVIGAEHGQVCRIHAAMPSADRIAMRQRFEAATGRALLVTTSALSPDAGLPGLGETVTSEPRIGFGTDAGLNVGFVLHHHAPASLEQYAREIAALRSPGTVALLFYDSSHRSMNQAILEQQRLPAHKVELFTRALETALSTGKPVKHEAIALQIGISRRTSERLIGLLVDAGIAERTATGIALKSSGPLLEKESSALAGALDSLQRGDLARLSAVERYAESLECKRHVLARHFGEPATASCGHCGSCRALAGVERKAQAR